MLSKSNFCFLSYVASNCLLASPIIHDLSCHHEEFQQPVLLPELLNCWCSALARALHFPCRAILCYCISFFPTEPDLVETKPCSFNSSRECECRPGLFCQSSVKYTCLRCQQHTVCKPGFGVKVRGRSSYLSSLPFLILALGLDLMHLASQSSVIILIQAPHQLMLFVKSALLGPSPIKTPAPTSASRTQSKSIDL